VRLSVLLVAMLATPAHARGASPYLPLNLSPEIERKIERVMLLAEQPLLTRPIAAAVILDALPRACERDAALCDEVRRYLRSLTRTAGISHASLSVGAGSGADAPLPNRHGMSSQSDYEAAAAVYWQPGDHLLVTGGAVAYEGDTTPTGTVASLGGQYFQIDVGYRDRWWSPFQDSAMLLSTQAATLPSVSVSNYTAFTRLNLRYEAFLAKSSESANIAFGGGTTTGKPRLAGLHLSIEPLMGWSIGVSRIMQYGGGERDDSLRGLAEAFFDPANRDNAGPTLVGEEFGNQAASFTSQFVLGDPFTVAVYFEYAGEDTSRSNSLRLGNSALSAGITLPKLGRNLSATFELSEWQNAWYVHHIYGDGLRNEDRVLGHWGADWRVLGDGVGARSAFARVTWEPAFGTLETSYRQLDNEEYSGGNYETARQIDARYSRPWDQVFVGAELTVGRDVFGDSYSRLGAFIRF
jgi:hypothetical protein